MAKPSLKPVENEHIVLRLLEAKDLLLTLAWRNQDIIRKWFVNSDPLSVDAHFAWFEQYKKLDTDFIFLIIAKELGNIPVGQVSLYRIDQQSLRAEYGRLMIGDMAARGKGYARIATRLLVQYGFEKLHLREIFLEVKEDNIPAVNLYRSCGFDENARQGGLINMIIKNPILRKSNK